MNRRGRIVIAAALLAVFLAAPSPAPCAAKRITAQELVETIDAAKGKVVVVNFWASWCAPCKQEIPELISLRKDVGENEMLLLGVSVDQDPGQYQKFAGGAGFNYPVYLAGEDVPTLFGVSAIPRMIVLNKQGEVVYNRDGYVPGTAMRKLVKDLLGK